MKFNQKINDMLGWTLTQLYLQANEDIIEDEPDYADVTAYVNETLDNIMYYWEDRRQKHWEFED